MLGRRAATFALLALALAPTGCMTAELWDWAAHDRYRFAWTGPRGRSVVEDRCPDRGPVTTPDDKLGVPHRHLVDRATVTRALDELRPLDAPDATCPGVAASDAAIGFASVKRHPEGGRPRPAGEAPRTIVLAREGGRWKAWELTPGNGEWSSFDAEAEDWAPTGGARVLVAALVTPFSVVVDLALTPLGVLFGL